MLANRFCAPAGDDGGNVLRRAELDVGLDAGNVRFSGRRGAAVGDVYEDLSPAEVVVDVAANFAARKAPQPFAPLRLVVSMILLFKMIQECNIHDLHLIYVLRQSKEKGLIKDYAVLAELVQAGTAPRRTGLDIIILDDRINEERSAQHARATREKAAARAEEPFDGGERVFLHIDDRAGGHESE